jgi:hypothetical protein
VAEPKISGDILGPGAADAPIPSDVTARMNEIREAQLDALEDAAYRLDEALGKAARVSIARIKAADYKPAVIRREVKWICAHTNSQVRRVVAEQIQDAALYADRAADVMRAWEIRTRLAADGGKVADAISPSQVRRARVASKYGSNAEVSRRMVADLRLPKDADQAFKEFGATAGKKPLDPKFTGDKLIQTVRAEDKKIIKSAPEISLSERLHGANASNMKDVNRAIGRVIRETEGYDHAQRVLIREARLGGDVSLTKPLERMNEAGKRLARASAGGDPEAIRIARKKWDKEYRRIEKIASNLKDERGGYRELLQDLKGAKVEKLDSALDKWLSQKQRYNANRIVNTEAAAAHRAREYKQQSKKPYITGAYWRLNAGARRGFVKRIKPTLKSSKKWKEGRRCICEHLAGEFFSMAAIRDYPRMGHPHCQCWWEWSYDRKELINGPVTQADVDWYNALPD